MRTTWLLAASCVLSYTGVSFGQGACEMAKLTASLGQSGDRFGYSVAVDSDAAIVGMTPGVGGPYDEYAWIFQCDPETGDWLEVAVIVDPDSQPGGGFGENVAISGDLVIVGADNAGHDCPADCSGPGAAYIFWRDQGGIDNWGFLVEIEPPDPVCECGFGISVSIDGDTAIVGLNRLSVVSNDMGYFPPEGEPVHIRMPEVAQSYRELCEMLGMTEDEGTALVG